MGKPINVNIGGEEFQISPLKLENLGILMRFQTNDPDKQAKALQDMIKKTLRNSVPDSTDEEINEIAITHFQPLSDAIMKVNGLDVNAAKTKGQDKPSAQQ